MCSENSISLPFYQKIWHIFVHSHVEFLFKFFEEMVKEGFLKIISMYNFQNLNFNFTGFEINHDYVNWWLANLEAEEIWNTVQKLLKLHGKLFDWSSEFFLLNGIQDIWYPLEYLVEKVDSAYSSINSLINNSSIFYSLVFKVENLTLFTDGEFRSDIKLWFIKLFYR